MTNLSNRQYPLLRLFATEPPEYRMSLADAHTFDQRPFRSMLMRGWVNYKAKEGFFLTKAGREAWREFENTQIGRKNAFAPLCGYFEKVWGDKKGELPVPKAPRYSRLPGLQRDTSLDRTLETRH